MVVFGASVDYPVMRVPASALCGRERNGQRDWQVLFKIEADLFAHMTHPITGILASALCEKEGNCQKYWRTLFTTEAYLPFTHTTHPITGIPACTLCEKGMFNARRY